MERWGRSSGKTARTNFGLSERGVGSRLDSGVKFKMAKNFIFIYFCQRSVLYEKPTSQQCWCESELD